MFMFLCRVCLDPQLCSLQYLRSNCDNRIYINTYWYLMTKTQKIGYYFLSLSLNFILRKQPSIWIFLQTHLHFHFLTEIEVILLWMQRRLLFSDLINAFDSHLRKKIVNIFTSSFNHKLTPFKTFIYIQFDAV